jgi:hypothetical protein
MLRLDHIARLNKVASSAPVSENLRVASENGRVSVHIREQLFQQPLTQPSPRQRLSSGCSRVLEQRN